MINPGVFKTRISFYRRNLSIVDEDGFKVPSSEEKFFSTKCEVEKLYYEDKRRSSSKNLDSSKTLVYCNMRYHKDINSDCIAEINNVKYRIQSVTNVKLENRFLKLVLQSG